ncbi:hypothetical protein REH70_04350 [Cellulomonas sp. ATA003]|nr:hypothetical protein [Cellulomonas sp. ATA003]WNB86474.1 hypothetical protein REH70_04350 [Cellulomonas sp. ATA003]
MHVGLARVLGEQGDLDAARAHLQSAHDLGEHAGLPQNAYRWLLESARLREADGDITGAVLLLDEAEPVLTTDFSPDVRPWLRSGHGSGSARVTSRRPRRGRAPHT